MDTAIVVYLDDNINLVREFNWLYRSWVLSGSQKVSDLVAFYNPKMTVSHQVDITYIPFQPLTERDASWANYPFINSIWHLTQPEADILKKYKYVLRTDTDCFLTPHFLNLRPRLATFGVGMYAQMPEVVIKLAQIADKWKILPSFNNVGSTMMAHSSVVLDYSKLHFEYCEKLRQDEFKNGHGEWPRWFFGVLSMYAGNLAANAFFGMNMALGGLDIHCMAKEPMCPTDYHIHAWHTYDDFSKFKWRNGEYKDCNLDILDKSIIANYCLWIAGTSP